MNNRHDDEAKARKQTVTFILLNVFLIIFSVFVMI